MEKPHSTLKGKILSFIRGYTSAASVTFKSHPISPRKSLVGKPMGRSVVSKDVNRRLKNGSFDAREPSSPIVSCIGQVKSKKKKKRATMDSMMIARLPPKTVNHLVETKKKDTPMVILKRYQDRKLLRTKAHHDNIDGSGVNEKTVPSLGHLKQIASGRGVLADFDWTTHCGTSMAVATESSYREDRQPETKTSPDSVPFDEIILKPKKEINIWKRRTMAPPPPLRL